MREESSPAGLLFCAFVRAGAVLVRPFDPLTIGKPPLPPFRHSKARKNSPDALRNISFPDIIEKVSGDMF